MTDPIVAQIPAEQVPRGGALLREPFDLHRIVRVHLPGPIGAVFVVESRFARRDATGGERWERDNRPVLILRHVLALAPADHPDPLVRDLRSALLAFAGVETPEQAERFTALCALANDGAAPPSPASPADLEGASQ